MRGNGRRRSPRRRSRSEQMALVRHKDTKPELMVRRSLWGAGLRYRLHARDIPGRPDLVFRTARLAVFVHGCFWHRHEGCSLTRTPKSNIAFWTEKFRKNVERDQKTQQQLRELGWHVEVIWECEAKKGAWLDRIRFHTSQATPPGGAGCGKSNSGSSSTGSSSRVKRSA